MSNQQILEKAIQKAIDNKWDVELTDILQEMQTWTSYRGQFSYPSGLLFNHDFAKALWGEIHSMKRHGATRFSPEGSIHCSNCGVSSSSEIDHCWQYHLQQMVIADDPIKYIGEHLDD